jgi:hypothetical protein
MGLRRQPRLKCVLPVRVVGTDANGKHFEQLACTLDISGSGARISGMTAPVDPGAVVTVYYKHRRAPFRVTWVGRSGSRSEHQIGVVTAAPDAHFWIEIPAEDLQKYVDQYGISETQQQKRVKSTRARSAEKAAGDFSPEEVTSRLRTETEELLELASLLEHGRVDAAALRQFRQALAYVRSTSWILQQWLELERRPGERLPLLKLLNTERLGIGTNVCNELAAFIASTKIQLDPNLVQQFIAAVQQLFLLVSTTQEAAAVTTPAE